jgi:hypothetical protein
MKVRRNREMEGRRKREGESRKEVEGGEASERGNARKKQCIGARNEVSGRRS